MPLEYQVYNIEPPPPACSACVSTACTFVGMFGVSLYYWPATTSVTRDYCASEPIGGPNTAYLPDINHTYVPITTGAYEIVDGITMYEGNIYLSYQEPRVEDNCGKDVTRQAPGHNVLTIASGDLHSLRKFPHALAPFPVTWDLVPWPVNFDDFTPPTPFSAYAGQRECAQPGLNTSSCTIVKPNEYYPYMLMPPQIRDLDPNWKNCLFDKYAAFDPPIALRTRGNMFSTVNAQPTSIKPVDPVHTPPMPGQSSGGGIAVPTTRPDDPSSPETQPPQDHNDDVHNSPPSRPQEPAVNSPTRTGTPKPNELNVLPRPVITVGPSTIMIDSSSRLVVQPGLTLKDGDPPVTVDGTVLSVGPSGIVLVGPKGTSTIQIPANANTGQLVTIGSATYTIANGELILGSKLTLSMSGAAVILSGTTISLASEGVMVVKSSSTTIIPIESTGAVTNEQDAAPSRDAEDSKDTYRTANSASRFTRQVAQLPLLALAIGLLIAPSLYT
ncbi:hypothetical protein BKA66DRAFT_574230 [Pyrenochaeta sp. MPI-SDFR-AT-0127]|nr:hypothetical protein BKA66DRAFT_574230 [Pyrenochaeta sp. MPI-SDFR-AT-0127]